MLLVTAYPILYALWLSLFRYDLRFPAGRQFVGLGNYLSVLSSEVWWRALAWKFAFDPTTGFVNALLSRDTPWFRRRWPAFFVIVLTEIWKTMPFMVLLLLSGLTLIPEDLIRAARVDGAWAWQRFRKLILPLMKPTILVALLFRTLDAFRIFDTVSLQTRGAQDTETVSIVAYNTLIIQLNLGLGSAVSVLIFCGVLSIAFLFVKGFGASFTAPERGFK